MSIMSKFFGYSVGKKQIMGILGLLLCVFALVHMTGNFLVFRGAEKFNAYGEFLHKIPAFWLVEIGFAVFFITHIILGIKLVIENRRARPVGYDVKRSAGGATLGSSTMAFTGIYFIIFLVLHVLNIRFAIFPSPSPGATEYDVTAALLGNPGWATFYIASALILGVHLSHGLQSSFQSLGLSNRHYGAMLKKVSVLYGFIIAIGYSMIAAFMLAKHL